MAEWLGSGLQNHVQRFESARDLKETPARRGVSFYPGTMNRMVLFLILSGLLILFDLYAYQGLKVAVAPLPVAAQRFLKIFFWGLTAITLLAFVLFQPLSTFPAGRKVISVVATIGVANILGKSLFVLWLVLDDVIRLGRYLWAKLNPAPEMMGDNKGISRLEFLAQAGALSATVPLLTMGWGVLSGAHDYKVRNRVLHLKNLPKAFDGMRILQISDLHVGSFWSKKAVERGVDLINEQKADMVFFTGDLVNDRASELNGWTDIFSRIRAEHGVYSVLGNHDYGDYIPWESLQAKQDNLRTLISAQRQMGWDLLINENRIITLGNESIAILGVENWGNKGHFPKYGDLARANEGIPEGITKLLLSHDPSHWRGQVLKEFKDIGVTFSGHTHGMQFGIEVGSVKWSPVKYFYPEWADLYEEGEQMLYVNRGFGYIGYPGRFGILPEITVFTLKQA